jgi:hypothetical protein
VAHPASYLANPMFLSFFLTSSSPPPLSYSLFIFFLYLFKGRLGWGGGLKMAGV